MAKSTKAHGPTFTDAELSDPVPSEVMKQHATPKVTRFMIGGEPQSVGSNSSQSSDDESSSNETLRKDPQEPALTTESPSSQPQTETATDVASTGGNGLETDKESDDVPPYEDWSVKDLKAECEIRGLLVSGNKSDLISRLDEDDAVSAETD